MVDLTRVSSRSSIFKQIRAGRVEALRFSTADGLVPLEPPRWKGDSDQLKPFHGDTPNEGLRAGGGG